MIIEDGSIAPTEGVLDSNGCVHTCRITRELSRRRSRLA